MYKIVALNRTNCQALSINSVKVSRLSSFNQLFIKFGRSYKNFMWILNTIVLSF